jgi:hypothetical protein
LCPIASNPADPQHGGDWRPDRAIETLFGLPSLYAVIIVGIPTVGYVTFGGMIAATWRKSALSRWPGSVSNSTALIAKASEVHPTRARCGRFTAGAVA